MNSDGLTFRFGGAVLLGIVIIHADCEIANAEGGSKEYEKSFEAGSFLWKGFNYQKVVEKLNDGWELARSGDARGGKIQGFSPVFPQKK